MNSNQHALLAEGRLAELVGKFDDTSRKLGAAYCEINLGIINAHVALAALRLAMEKGT